MHYLALLLVLAVSTSAVSAQAIVDKKVDKKEEKKKEEGGKKDYKPHPLVAQIDTALSVNQIIEPPGYCAYDLYQILSANEPNEPALKTLKNNLFLVLGRIGSAPLNEYIQGTDRIFTREDWAKALQYITRARELKSDDKELKQAELFYQGMISLSEKQPTKAEELFRQGIKQDEKAAFFYNALGRALSDQKKDDEAIKSYAKANLLAPQWTYPLVNMAIKYQRRGELELAKRSAQAAIEINIKDIDAHAVLASVNASLGNIDDAIAEYQTVVLQRPQSVNDHISLGRLLMEKGSLAEAEQVFTVALRLNPLDARTRLYLSTVLSKRAQEEFDKAYAQVKESATKLPEDWQLRLTLITGAEQRGKRDEAIEAINAALKIEPWHINLKLQLAELLLESDRVSEAVQQYREIIKSAPSVKEAYNGLGLALKKSGQIKEAIVEFRKALTLEPTYLLARYHLGTCLQEKGEFEAAASEYRLILSAEPTNQAAAAALKEIEGKLAQPPKQNN